MSAYDFPRSRHPNKSGDFPDVWDNVAARMDNVDRLWSNGSASLHRTLGKSTAGFRAKKSNGRSSNSCQAAGIMGQSSGRATWWNPIVYQTTMSVFSIG